MNMPGSSAKAVLFSLNFRALRIAVQHAANPTATVKTCTSLPGYGASATARQVLMSASLTGTLTGLPSRVEFVPFTTGQKQSNQRPLSLLACPGMNPNFEHSLIIFSQAGLALICFSLSGLGLACCVVLPCDGFDAVCAVTSTATIIDTRKKPDTKSREIISLLITLSSKLLGLFVRPIIP
jgi:hypothetical protein